MITNFLLMMGTATVVIVVLTNEISVATFERFLPFDVAACYLIIVITFTTSAVAIGKKFRRLVVSTAQMFLLTLVVTYFVHLIGAIVVFSTGPGVYQLVFDKGNVIRGSSTIWILGLLYTPLWLFGTIYYCISLNRRIKKHENGVEIRHRRLEEYAKKHRDIVFDPTVSEIDLMALDKQNLLLGEESESEFDTDKSE
jgi:hypothetical protein